MDLTQLNRINWYYWHMEIVTYVCGKKLLAKGEIKYGLAYLTNSKSTKWDMLNFIMIKDQ